MPNSFSIPASIVGFLVGALFTAAVFLLFGFSDSRGSRDQMPVHIFQDPQSEFLYVVIWCQRSFNGRTGAENAQLALQHRAQRRVELGLHVDTMQPGYESPGILQILDQRAQIIAGIDQIEDELRETFGCESDWAIKPTQ